MDYTYEEVGFKGKYIKIRSISIDGVILIIKGFLLRIANLKEEDYHNIGDPLKIIETLRALKSKPDIFSFKQRYPNISKSYNFHVEHESIAVLNISSYRYWVEKQISQNAKRAIEKAKKKGVEVRLSKFDSSFIEGVIDIFNESPIRQNKPFWHYGKDYTTIEQEFSKFLFREDIIGAYFEGKLIGFIFLANTDNYAIPTQIISKIAHQDKGVMSVLLAKAVELCEERKIPSIVYGDWQESGLTEFKRRNGFEKVLIPRYYIPISWKGKIAIQLGLHHGILNILPKPIRLALLGIRSAWHSRKRRS